MFFCVAAFVIEATFNMLTRQKVTKQMLPTGVIGLQEMLKNLKLNKENEAERKGFKIKLK